MDKISLTAVRFIFYRRLRHSSSIVAFVGVALLAAVSTHARALGETPPAELLNPQYSENTSSFTFILLNREKAPREYQFESQLHSQGKLLQTNKHEILPEFSETKASEPTAFALSATLSIPIKQVLVNEDGIYALRVIGNSRGKDGDAYRARMWIRFQQRGGQVRVLSQSEYTKLIQQSDKSGDFELSVPSRDGFGKVDPDNASSMLPVVIAAEKAPINEREDKSEAPKVELRTKRPLGVVDVRDLPRILRNRGIAMDQMRPSSERKGVFVPPYEPLQDKDRTEVNE